MVEDQATTLVCTSCDMRSEIPRLAARTVLVHMPASLQTLQNRSVPRFLWLGPPAAWVLFSCAMASLGLGILLESIVGAVLPLPLLGVAAYVSNRAQLPPSRRSSARKQLGDGDGDGSAMHVAEEDGGCQ